MAAGPEPAAMVALAPPISLLQAVRCTSLRAASAVAHSDVCTAAAAPSACHTAGKRARAALAGFTLGTMTETDGLRFYLLRRWGMFRTLPDLASVVVFLRQVGGA